MRASRPSTSLQACWYFEQEGFFSASSGKCQARKLTVEQSGIKQNGIKQSGIEQMPLHPYMPGVFVTKEKSFYNIGTRCQCYKTFFLRR
jgi:hypothetical protein